jgi:secreted Zn-dependent insulinase-like peptidase
VPQKIKEYNETEVWYKKDDKFKRPKAIISIKVYPQQGVLEGLGMTVRGKM